MMVRRSLIAGCAAFLAFVAPTVQAEDKVRIAVVDFDTEALQGGWHYGWHWSNLARAAADNLANQLVKLGKFSVIERQQLDKVLAEQNLGASGRVDPSTAARMGKILGVQLIVVGAVTEFEVAEKGGRLPGGLIKGLPSMGARVVTGKCKLAARLVDTTTAEILGAFDGDGAYTFGKGDFKGASLGTDWNDGMASKVLGQAVEKLATDIGNKGGGLAPSTARGGIEGKVANVQGDKIYLNVGGGSGIKVGDKFEIRRVGEQIKDPDTGEVLGGEETNVGVIEVTQVVNDKLSLAKPVSGSGFAKGDRAIMK
jgi:curli biogenesis system outer membrane secretion channel CsgG